MSSSIGGARQALLDIWEGIVASSSGSCVLSDDFDNKEYSAANLDAASQDLVRLLMRSNIKKNSTAIGICLSPGVAEAVVLLAALRCGVPWVPLPSTKAAAAESLDWLGERVGVLVCDESSYSTLVSSIVSGRAVFILNRDGSVSNRIPGAYDNQNNESESDRPTKRSRQSLKLNEDCSSPEQIFEDDILYVMRTSGSTGGDLKFVRGRVSSTLNRLQWQWRSMPFASIPSRSFESHSLSVVCRRSPLVFVDSIAEILGTLLGGAVLFVPASSLESDPANFVAACGRGRVSRITLVPSLLEHVLNYLPRLCKDDSEKNGNSSTSGGVIHSLLPRMTEWIVSGETVTKSLVDNFLIAVGGPSSTTTEKACFAPSLTSGPMRLINLYGSTEITADVTACVLVGPPLEGVPAHFLCQVKSEVTDRGLLTCADARDGSGIPVGFAIDNVDLDIVQIHGDGSRVEQSTFNVPSSESALAHGTQGEVVVRGIMVANGYCCKSNALKTSNETHSRFGVQSKSAHDSAVQKPWFRTGDLGFQCRDCGILHLIGRVDNQVKIRGVRLSLEEAEEALREIMTSLGLSNMVAVVLHEITMKYPFSTTQRLVAFVVASSSETETNSLVSAISKAAARLLPGHFVPSAIVVIDSLPRNRSGKLDRRALAASLDKADDDSAAAEFAQLTLQEWLISTLETLLKNSCSPAQYFSSSFRELGGDSLMAIELAWLCGEEVSRRRATKSWKSHIEVATDVPTAAKVLAMPLLELLQQLEDAVIREPSCNSAESSTVLPFEGSLNAFDQQELSPTNDSVPGLSGPSAGEVPSWLTRAGLGSCGAVPSLNLEPLDRGPLKSGLSVRWRLNLGRCVDASALVVQAVGSGAPLKAYIGAHSRVVAACEVATGAEFWRREVVSAGAPRIGDDAAIEATAAVSADGAVLLVACYDGSLLALSTATGVELWRCMAEAEIKGAPLVYAPPAEALMSHLPPSSTVLSSLSEPPQRTRGFTRSVYAGCAFFASHDATVRCVFVGGMPSSRGLECHVSSPSGVSTLSPTAATNCTPGTLWWRFSVDGAVYASLALAFVPGGVRKRQAKGNKKGSSSSSSKSSKGPQGSMSTQSFEAEKDAALETLDELLLTATTKGTLYAHHLDTLKMLASNDAGDESQSDASIGGVDSSGVPAPPTMVWRYAAGAPLFATPTVHAPLGIVVCATVGGRVMGVNLRDGTPSWMCLLSRAVFSSPTLWHPPLCPASLADASDSESLVVIGCHDGTLSCRTAAGGRRVWTIHLAEACQAELAEECSHVDSSGADAVVPTSVDAGGAAATPPEVPAEDPISAAPFVFLEGGSSYGSGRRRALVCAASQSGLVAVLDLKSGKPLAAIRLPGLVFSSPVVINSDPRDEASAWKHHVILVGCRDDHLYAIDFFLSRNGNGAVLKEQ